MIPTLFAPINPTKACSLLQRSLLLPPTFDFLPFSPMDSFTLLKFWKPTTARVAECGDSVCYNVAADDCLVPAEEEEEESFFELEFTLPGNDQRGDCKEEQIDGKVGRIGDFISDEKADVRIGFKPQSPMSILKQSAPKLRVLMFGNLTKKSKPEKSSENQSVSDADSKSPKRKTKIKFTVKLRIEDAASMKKRFTRSESSRIVERRSSGDKELDGSSRRFTKDSVHKYLNLIKKPLYVKLSSAISKPSSDSLDSASTASFTSPRKSEERTSSNSRFRVSCKNLGKSRSASSLFVGVSSPAAPWKDDSLAQQNDGIQGAILHCKQSFNSSSKGRVMSRSVSDTSYEKSNQRTV